MANLTRDPRATATTRWYVATRGTAPTFDTATGTTVAEDAMTVRAGRSRRRSTWIVQSLVRVAEVHADTSSAGQVGTTVSRIVVARHRRYRMAGAAMLRAHLTHAHALLIPGRTSAAVSEIPRARDACQWARAFLTPGRLDFLLVRAQIADPTAGMDALAAVPAALRLVWPAGRVPAEKPSRRT